MPDYGVSETTAWCKIGVSLHLTQDCFQMADNTAKTPASEGYNPAAVDDMLTSRVYVSQVL